MLKKKKELLDRLYKRDGHKCHYCHIQEGDFLGLWGKFYALPNGLPKRGTRLEIDHKDAVVLQGKSIIKVKQEDTPEKCVLACALCNMAKSNMFTHDEFEEVGKVIEKIWREREEAGLKVKCLKTHQNQIDPLPFCD